MVGGSVADDSTPESPRKTITIHARVASPNSSMARPYPNIPIISTGLRPTLSDRLPHSGPNSISVSAAVATRMPMVLPPAPMALIRKGNTGMTMPNPSMTTARLNTSKNRLRRLVVFIMSQPLLSRPP